MNTTTLKLRGMSCASCANSIESAIRAIPGVSESNVNFGIERASVTYNSAQTDVAAIQAAVVAAGYSAEPIQEQDLLNGDNDTERKTRQAESRDLHLKVWTGGIISAILVIGSIPMMTGSR